MMQLSGLGDPSGFGEGFSFLRKVDNKPAKAAVENNELNAHVKKITVSVAMLRSFSLVLVKQKTKQKTDNCK